MLDYIVDFYCHEIGLVIEIDGVTHDHAFLEDAKRKGEIEAYGVTFIRFTNEEVKNEMFSVLLVLQEIVNELKE